MLTICSVQNLRCSTSCQSIPHSSSDRIIVLHSSLLTTTAGSFGHFPPPQPSVFFSCAFAGNMAAYVCLYVCVGIGSRRLYGVHTYMDTRRMDGVLHDTIFRTCAMGESAPKYSVQRKESLECRVIPRKAGRQRCCRCSSILCTPYYLTSSNGGACAYAARSTVSVQASRPC